MRRALFAGLTLLLGACGGDDRPPPLADQVDPDIPGDDLPGGSAGSNQVGSAGNSNLAGAGNGTGDPDPPPTGASAWDPLQVYLYGSLVTGVSCDGRAVANVTTPNSYVTGFPCEAPASPVLHDGELYYVYQLDRTLRRFVADTSSDSEPVASAYPETPQDNDEIIATAGCTGVYEIAASPDGVLAYNCMLGQPWYVMGTDDLLFEGGALLALGNGGIALLGSLPLDPGGHRVRVLPGGSSTVITGLPEHPDNKIAAIRSHEDGFRLAVMIGIPSEPTRHELWQVSAAGVGTLVGQLPLPDDVDWVDVRGALTPDGAFLRPINIENRRGIYRINTEGEGSLAYDIAEAFLKYGAQRMITGP